MPTRGHGMCRTILMDSPKKWAGSKAAIERLNAQFVAGRRCRLYER